MTQKKADLLIALVSIIWGSSYLLMKLGLADLGVFNLIALRFGIAFLITLPLFWQRLRRASRQTLGYAALLGLVLFGTFTALMFGLQTTPTSSAGFLTSTAVVFVLLIQIAITKRLPRPLTLIGTIFTLIGIAFLTIKGSFSLAGGSLLCLLGAFCYGCHIVVTNYLTRKTDGIAMAVYQLGFVGLYGLLFSFLFEIPTLPQTTTGWLAVLGQAIICSALGIVIQTYAQRYTTPERTGLLFCLEPVAAAFLGFIFLQEVLPFSGYLGALLVLGGVALSGLPPRRLSSHRPLYFWRPSTEKEH